MNLRGELVDSLHRSSTDFFRSAEADCALRRIQAPGGAAHCFAGDPAKRGGGPNVVSTKSRAHASTPAHTILPITRPHTSLISSAFLLLGSRGSLQTIVTYVLWTFA